MSVMGQDVMGSIARRMLGLVVGQLLFFVPVLLMHLVVDRIRCKATSMPEVAEYQMLS